MPRSYVNNAYNRSVGRVGMPVGSCVVSSGSTTGGGSGGGGHSGGSSYSSSGYGYESAPSTPRTYVDNAYNRSAGRVGLEVGSCVISSGSTGSVSRSNASGSRSSDSPNVYVDNAYNRSVGRVGLPHGSAVVTSDSSYGGGATMEVDKFYVDNAYNRRLGRVGLPLGAAKMSTTTATSGSSGSVSSSGRVYVDNAFNRRLGRVGKPVGTAQYKPSEMTSSEESGSVPRGRKLRNVHPEVYRPLYDFDPEDDVIYDFYRRLEAKKQEYLNQPKMYRDCEVAQGVINRHEASLTQKKMKSKLQSKPKWMDGGDVIDWEDLEIGEKLGSGGFGDVHVAIWKGEFQVAVKKLRVQRVQEKKRLQFEQEVRAFSSLSHPRIVEFYGACVRTPNICIVMEFMGGGSLYDVLHIECRPLTMEQKFQISEDILSALEYIHGRNVIHRDIKSLNVLMSESYNHCKLGDFGVALKQDEETSTSAADFSVVGTIRYSAPELLEGNRLTVEEYKAVDIYAAALTIFETFVEEIPFDGLNMHQLRKAVLDGERPGDSECDTEKIPGDLKEVIEQGWVQRADKRLDAKRFLRKIKKARSMMKTATVG